MLWRIDGSDTYILGSIHLADLDPAQLPATARQAFAASTRVTFETDLERKPDLGALSLPDNVKLSDIVSDTVNSAVVGHCQRLGLSESNLQLLRPGVIALALLFSQAAQCGYVEQRGVDRPLWDQAERDGKAREQLETFDFQVGVLTGAPMTEQVSMLSHIVEKPDVGLSELTGLVAAWIRGDILHFEAYLAERRRRWPATFKALIDQRNTSWVPAIVEMAADREPRLVIVGALHLVGPTGLPRLLEQCGIQLSRQEWVI
jgi:uncharacterized protein YbaP (TraB family)